MFLRLPARSVVEELRLTLNSDAGFLNLLPHDDWNKLTFHRQIYYYAIDCKIDFDLCFEFA